MGQAEARIVLVTEEEDKRMAEVRAQLAGAEQVRAEGLRKEEDACVELRAQRKVELQDEREAAILAATTREEEHKTSGGSAEVATRKSLGEQAASLDAQLRAHLEEGTDGEGRDSGLQLVLSARVGLNSMEHEQAQRRRRERLKQREAMPDDAKREDWMRVRRVENQLAPVQLWVMDVVSSGRGVREIACGSAHAMAVTVDGELWAWGSNAHGQLALGEPLWVWVWVRRKFLCDGTCVCDGRMRDARAVR